VLTQSSISAKKVDGKNRAKVQLTLSLSATTLQALDHQDLIGPLMKLGKKKDESAKLDPKVEVFVQAIS
jgi:hypothetical protein